MSTDRAPLSRERILATAVAMADDDGVDSLSMRKLARELGYEPMSLYNHVDNKDDLLGGMVDMVIAEVDEAVDEPDWRTALRTSAVSAHEMLLRHPWAAAIWSTTEPGPGRLRHMEHRLAALRERGFSPEVTYLAYHALDTHVIGSTREEIDLDMENLDLDELAAEFLSALPRDEFPYLHEHVDQHLDTADRTSEFDFVLDMILDRLEVLRDES